MAAPPAKICPDTPVDFGEDLQDRVSAPAAVAEPAVGAGIGAAAGAGIAGAAAAVGAGATKPVSL